MVKTSVKTDKKAIQRSGNKALYKQAKYTLNREIRVTKKNYSGKLKKSFQVTTLHQCGKAGKPSPATRPHPPALRPINNWLKTWTSSTAGLKTKAWSDTPHPLWPSHNTAIHTLPLPPHYGFSACNQDLWRICKQSLQDPSSHWSSTDHCSCVKSPPASNAPPSSLYPINKKSQDLMPKDLLL